MRPDASLRRPAIAATLLLPTVAVGLTLAPATLPAQDQPGPGAVVRAPNLPPGTVIGHVTCSDTNGPARFASVFLQPVVSPKAATHRDRPDFSGPGMVNKIVQTGLDGSFTLTNVAPGDYYILADAPGYRSAAGVLTREQMDHPTEAQAKLIAQLLTPVSVASNRTSTAEVRLLRGAALAGTVRFDDGTPFAGANLRIWRKNDSGKYESYVSHFMHPAAQANDAGQFRFSGLPAGEYRVSAALEIDETFTDAVFGPANSYSSDPTYELPIFSESTDRAKDAQTINLADGQTESSIGIEIPLSKLHGISGMLVEEGTAHRINAGKITLVYADDNTQLASADVSPEDEAFHLPYVPEGTYTIKVSEAKEVSRTVVSNGPGFFPPTHIETKVIRTFGDTTQPLIVTTDVQGLIISVPAAKPTPTP